MKHSFADAAVAASIKRYISGLGDEEAIAVGLLSALADRANNLPNADMGEAITLIAKGNPTQLSQILKAAKEVA